MKVYEGELRRINVYEKEWRCIKVHEDQYKVINVQIIIVSYYQYMEGALYEG